MGTSIAMIGRTRPVIDTHQVKYKLPAEYRDAATVIVDITLVSAKNRIAIKDALRNCFGGKQVVLPEGNFNSAHYVAVVDDPDEPWSEHQFRQHVADCVNNVQGVLATMS